MDITSKDPVAMTGGSVASRLLQALVTELKLESPRFVSQSEVAQQEVIDRLAAQVESAVTDAVNEIAAKSFRSVRAQIISVAFKDGVKVQLSLSTAGQHEAVHAVADAVDGYCSLVLADPQEFTGGTDEVKPTPPQGDLPLGGPEDET